nr:MAG TPA: hypothetical protein [Caudoviricetes sp.]
MTLIVKYAKMTKCCFGLDKQYDILYYLFSNLWR